MKSIETDFAKMLGSIKKETVHCMNHGDSKAAHPESLSGYSGRGRGFGRGRRHGRMSHLSGVPGHMHCGCHSHGEAKADPAAKIEFLNNRAKFFEKKLQHINSRLAELNKDGDELSGL
jgi:hypothetical protein